MTNPVYFTVVADFKAFIEDAASDADYNPQIVPVSATVTFTPIFNAGDVALATQATPRPIGYIPTPITAIIDPADGRLKLRTATDAGASGATGGQYGFAPVRLLGTSPVLELDGPLFYSVSFSEVLYANNRRGSITGFTFEAPNNDTELNLISVFRQPGVAPSGITKIAPGGVRLASNGTSIIFTFAGVDLADPISLAGVTGPTGATGTAATISVGSVQTGSPGSNVTVTNSGSSGAAVFNFTIPRGDVGATGATGAQGPTGAQGIQGQPGVSLDIQGTVSNYAALPSNPAAGDAYLVADQGLLYYFDGTSWPSNGNGVAFVGPQGPVGAQGIQGIQGPVGASGGTGGIGATGAAATIAVGSVQTGTAGSSVQVSNSGSSGAAVFDFTIPRGDVGATGPTGPTGPTGASGGTGGTGAVGPAGQAANILGGVATYANLPSTTGLTDGDAYVVAADGRLYIFDGSAFPADGAGVPFVGPVGATGPAGSTGASGEQGASGIPGGTGGVGATGPAGTTSWNGITDKPSTFTPSAHTHVATDISDSTSVGRSVLTAANEAAARTAIGAEGTAAKGTANGYASLDSNGRVPAQQLPNSIMTYNGLLDVPGNSPVLSDATGDAGDVYRISVAGTRNFGSGNITLDVGDYLIHSGSIFQKADTTDAVSTVAGRTGDIVLTKSDVGLGNVDNTADASKDVLSATKLTTPRTINGVSFDGTANITVPAGIQRSVQTITTPTTLAAAANTDYVYFLNSINLLGADPNLASVTALLFGNGTNASTAITDNSPLASNWTATGGVALSTSTKQFGTASISFPGSLNAYMTPTAASSNFAFGPNNFTVEFWVRANSWGDIVLANWHSTSNPLRYPMIYTPSGGILGWWVNNSQIVSTGTLATNSWHHVAFCRSSGTLRSFVNGNLVGSAIDNSDYLCDSNRPLLGGYAPGSSAYWFNGFIDDFCITKGVARYTSSFTAPTSELSTRPVVSVGTPTLPTAVSNTNQYTLKNITSSPISVLSTSSQTIDGASTGQEPLYSSVVALLSGDGENGSTAITDSSPLNSAWTAAGGAKISTSQSKFGVGSIQFSTVGDRITSTAAKSNFAFGTSAFTVEVWLRFNSTSVVQNVFLDETGGGSGLGWILGSDGKLSYYAQGGYRITGATALAANTWYHIALSRSGTTSRLFIDGLIDGTWASDNLNFGSLSYTLGWSGSSFLGFADDLRITKDQARYTANFTPPTTGLASIGGLAAGSTQRLISDGSNWRTV